MNLKTIALSILTVLPGLHALGAQEADTIFLTNPSFEDYPRPGRPPTGWYDCGFPGETPPDVQPDPTFSVGKPAFHGDTYLGMVVRDNDTWESVSQRLSKPMKKGQCYDFSLALARSELYISISRVKDEEANYVTPAKIRLYGGFGYCDKQYMLAESKLIINTRWLEYNFRLEPIADYTYFTIEVFYQTPTLFPYNGNVLLDNASAFVPVPCDEEIAQEAPTPPPVTETPAPARKPATRPEPSRTEPAKPAAKSPPVAEKTPKPEPQKPEPPKAQPVEEEVFIGGIKRSELKEGKTIRIDKLYFEANKANITEDSYTTLEEVYNFLQKNPDLIVEIGGHTNGLMSTGLADQLSLSRAKAVADFLIKRGIDSARLATKGYGKTAPIADNSTLAGRRMNQRVELKILGFKRG